MACGLVAGVVAGSLGCGAMTGPGSRGQTLDQHRGSIALVFANASPQKMCALRMAFDEAESFGDNWLPAEGLPTGKSITFHVKPGTYKATWNTCLPRTDAEPYYAGTLTQELAFEVGEATQLFAFVADTVAPTSRAAPEDFHTLVKFAGQRVGGRSTPQVASTPAPTVPNELTTAADPPKRTSMREFVDRDAKRRSTRKGTPVSKRTAGKASLQRQHDLSSASVGYKVR